MYFPYVEQLESFYTKLKWYNKDYNIKKYYGSLDKINKADTMSEISSGGASMVLATKAFGMGMDVPDIKNVYHFAPTGNLSDYIQEIGRVARTPDMIGIASIDYFEQDFRYINKLYGLSEITD